VQLPPLEELTDTPNVKGLKLLILEVGALENTKVGAAADRIVTRVDVWLDRVESNTVTTTDDTEPTTES